MDKLIAIAERVTGKRVNLSEDYMWLQEEDAIFVPAGDEEGLLHEILHWVVASDEERTWPNLALDDDDIEINEQLPPEDQLGYTPDSEARERQACWLERKVYAIRGWVIPSAASCTSRGHEPEDIVWAEHRAALYPGLIEELAAALITGNCGYGGFPVSRPESLPVSPAV